MARGDCSAAVKLLRKAIPFPAIIGAICDQPCQSGCNRSRLGGAIEMAALEHACARLGETAPPRIPLLPSRGKSIAIIGGGLSGLTAAFDLRKKGYAVTVFEAADRLGGTIWKTPAGKLNRELADRDFSVLAAMGIEIRLRTQADPDKLPGFDARYIATGVAAGRTVDPVTYATEQKDVFTGGSLLRSPGNYSPILSVSDGRRAAVSIDRYLQGASLTAVRLGEGSLESCLYTNLEAVAPAKAAAAAGQGYTAEEAQREAGRCLQCQCLECVKVCRYLESYGGYPKKYVREIYNNLSIVMGVRQSNALTNSCSLCGLCAEVCPNDLSMADVCSDARRTMVTQKRMPPSAHDFALRDMLSANSNACTLARPAPGSATCGYIFFPGCQLAASAPDHVEKAYRLLQEKLAGGIGLMLRCCGAPADWAGRDDLLGRALDECKKELLGLGSPRVILACPSCSRAFKRHLPEVETVSLWELLAKEELGAAAAQEPQRTYAVHDPCACRYDTGLHEAVRRIARDLGCTIEELRLSRQKTTCCSFGGLQWFANNRLAKEVLQRRLQESGRDYLTYCSMCRDLFAAQGKRCLHLLDLVFEREIESRGMRPCPDWSQRRENRLQLRRMMLKEHWDEETAAEPGAAAMRLVIPVEVRSVLEARLILDDDIRQVIRHAQTTGRRLRHAEAGHCLAYHKIGSVTYWVEYRPADGGFEVLNACSHRMDIVSEKTTPSAQAGAAQKPAWLCDCCGAGLELANVEIAYLGSAFPVELFCCSACRIVYIPEELVLTRMADAEKILEDK
jgi:Fe-S oxidoreductase